MISDNVKLAWCLQNSARKHISDFEEWRGATKNRPDDLRCPCCDEPVVVALSPEQKISDYFRHHKADSSCVIHQGGESAAHLNAKIYMAELLRLGEFLHIENRCQKCDRIGTIIVVQDYQVEIEYRTDTRRPDLALLNEGQLTLAVEIFHTHKVDRAKAGDFSEQGIKWIEIKAEEAVTLTRDDDNVIYVESDSLNDHFEFTYVCDECEKRSQKTDALLRVAALANTIELNRRGAIMAVKQKGIEPQIFSIYSNRPLSNSEALALLDSSLDAAPWWFNWEWDEIRIMRQFLGASVHVE